VAASLSTTTLLRPSQNQVIKFRKIL
jgi:hypothetical protein